MPPVRARACDICYKRKIQCSIPSPDTPCNWCSHHDLACTFTRDLQKNTKNRAKLSDVQELFRRIEQLEGALAQHTANHPTSDYSEPSTTPAAVHDSSPQSTSLASPDGQSNAIESTPHFPSYPQSNPQLANLAFGQILFSGSHLGLNWLYKGIPILSEKGEQWISSQTNEQVSLRKFPLFGSQRALPATLFSTLHQVSSPNLWELPDKARAQIAFDIFLRSSFRQLFPVIDPVLFQQTIEAAYETLNEDQLSHQHVSAKVCILAALAMMSRAKGLHSGFTIEDGDVYASKAQCLLGSVLEEASLESLQAVIMLQKHQLASGQWQNASNLHSIACRFISRLGGQIYHPVDLHGAEMSYEERQGHHIRMLFWLCYMIDKDISLRSGHAPLLNEDYCDLTLPENYANCYTHLPQYRQPNDNPCLPYEVPVVNLPGDPILAHIKEKTCRILYSPQSYRVSDGQLLSHIRQLDGELEKWRLSIPNNFRPHLYIAPSRPLPVAAMGHVDLVRYINLQLEYHYLMIAIHSTVRRCPTASPPTGKMPEPIHQVVHSSIDLSLEASRSTIRLLEVMVNTLPEEAFWSVICYFTVASVSLFVNFLLHPTDAQVQIDVEFLVSAVGIIESMPMQTLTLQEIEHVRKANEFVLELARLGRCAIVKGRREEGEFI